jgi:hypothetical protein
MTQNHRQSRRSGAALNFVQFRVTDAARGNADQDFTWPRPRLWPIDQLQRLIHFFQRNNSVQYHGPHGNRLLWAYWINASSCRQIYVTGCRHASGQSSRYGGRRTELRVVLKYDALAGKVANWLARLFRRAPEQKIHDDLRHFKQWIETGAIATSSR